MMRTDEVTSAPAGVAQTAAGGRDRPPRWARPALAVLLAVTAVCYVWGLGASGWANAFYSAAVQAGATSWKAFFFGASDAAGFITVDKTPAALWPMALSARVFGVNSWSILVPQALMGVATVAVLHAAVRRSLAGAVGASAAAAAGLGAGAALAVTPVAALMFRFNNPDALLVLLLAAAAYAMVRSLEHPGGRGTGWLVAAGCCVGAGFLAKMLQAFLVVPGFALVYLLVAPVPLRRRLVRLVAAGAALAASAGWWVLAVALVPAGSRPYVGGSQGNSVLELALGYNGLGRLNGDEVGGLGNLDADAGWARMFGPVIGGQVSWLLPAALLLAAAALWARRAEPRTDPARAGLLLWGGWLAVHLVVFSFMRGIFHEYYTVALAPAVAALAASGTALLWRRRDGLVVLAAAVAATALWSYVLLGRVPDWHPWLRWTVLGGGAAAAVLVGLGRAVPRRIAAAGAVLAVVVALAGPAAYAADTIATPHTGAIPVAGPSTGGGGPGGMRRPGGFGPGGGGRPGGGMRPPGAPAGRPGQGPGPGPGRGGGGLLDAATPGARLTALLKADAGSFTWVAAAVGSNAAAGHQLATGLPVMAVGGFNGTDPAPGLARFQEYVRRGRIHYFLGSGGPGAGRVSSGSDQAQRIAGWVSATFTAQTVDGVTVYDLTAG